MTTKIHATVDALGNPTGFFLTPGQAADVEGADILLPMVAADTVIGDKGYDAETRVVQPLREAGKTVVIPRAAIASSLAFTMSICTKRAILLRTSLPNSSNSVPLPRAMTSEHGILSREYIVLLSVFGWVN